MKQVLTESIRIDGETQSRAQIDQDAVQEYADAMKAGTRFPPIVAFFDGTDYWCADGFHRVLAAQRAGIKHLSAEVQQGGQSEAAWAACGANQTHGIRRNNADKRKAVTLALKMHPEMSDFVLSEHCGVSAEFVRLMRRQVPTVGTCQPPTTRIGRDGKHYPAPPYRPPSQRLAPPPPGSRPPAGPPPAPSKPVGPVDSLGRRIPEKTLPLWERRDEVNGMLTALSRIRVAIREAQDIGDKLFAEVPYSTALVHLDQAYNCVQVAKPYVVCPFCQGHGCRACRERGLISKHRWDVTVPRELKAQVAALVEEEQRESK